MFIKRLATEFPFRAIGGNVLLRRVKMDGLILLLEGRDDRVLQVAEIIGLGSRWTQDAKWSPPMPTQDRHRQTENDSMAQKSMRSTWDTEREAFKPMWKYPDSSNPRRIPPRFTAAHEGWLEDLEVGELVVFNQARVYDHFEWHDENILVYPGNWILGVVEDSHLSQEKRRFEAQPL